MGSNGNGLDGASGSSDGGLEGHGNSDFDNSLLAALASTEAPPPPCPEPGDRLGGRDGERFEVQEPLGAGAMGMVFRAWDRELLRYVALKFIQPFTGLAEAPRLSLFQQEARAIARLDHENIVRLHDLGQWSPSGSGPSLPFLVMECLNGEPLDRYVRRARPDPRAAIGLMLQVAEGLAHAHESRVIHRDIKPGNVLVLETGKVKLLDFGLAQLRRAAFPTSAPLLPRAGTPAYMAPEQHRGQEPDQRADLWACGVLLFELLTGEHPYAPHAGADLAARITSPEPAPSVRQHRPELPEELERLVAAALAKDPDKRLRTAYELRERLRDVDARLARRRDTARAPASERRQVTLVACWLAGLTEPRPLDAEDFAELEDTFHRACERAIHFKGGTLVSAVGDEVLACFGYPQAHEDDSRNAVRAALDLLPEVERDLARVHRGRLAVRVGIHTDSVRVTAPAQPGGAPSLQGEAPRLARWLARQAESGGVVLGDTTRTLVSSVFKTRPLGARSFEGLGGATPIPVHRLVRQRRVRTRFAHARGGCLTPLVGRQHELRELLELWEGARRGESSMVVVMGEAGVGKSRLVQELKRRIPSESVYWVMGQCWSDSTHSPFYPAIHLLQRAYGISPDLPPARKLARIAERARARGLDAEETEVLAALLAPEATPPSKHSPERQREKTLELMVKLIRIASSETPMVLVYEDVHWADHSTLQFFEFMLDRLEGTRALMLLTARPELHVSWRPRPWLRTLPLERLSAEQAGAMVQLVAGGRPLAPEAVDQLVSGTDGIPLFVEEMARVMLAQSRDAEPRSVSIPATLHDLLLARLDLLPPWQRELTQLAAVAGRGFPPALLAACTGRSEVDLEEDFDDLVEAGVLQHDDVPEPSLQFRHALLQEAAYQSLSRATRRQHHARMAEVLRERFPRTVEEQPELLARHYTESGQVARALAAWARASEVASRRSAYVEAAGHLRQALRLWRELPDERQRRAEELPLRLALGVVQTEKEGFGAPGADRNYARIRELLRELGDALPQVELSYWSVFAFHFARAEFALAYDVAAHLVERGVRGRNPYLLSLGHRKQATVLFTWGDMDAAVEEVEHALAHASFDVERHREIARRQVLSAKHWADPTVMATAYSAVVYSAVGRPEEAWRRSREAMRMAEQLGNVNSTGYALTYTALACQLRREPECALRWADQAIALGREHRFLLWQVWPLFFRTWAWAELGHAEEALPVMRSALEHWRRLGMKAGMPHNLGMLADLHLKLGHAREGLGAVAEAFGWAERVGERSYEVELWRLRGELLRLKGDEDGAARSFQHALELAGRQGARGFGLRAAVSRARQLRELDAPEAALWTLERSLGALDPREESPDLAAARALWGELGAPALPSPVG